MKKKSPKNNPVKNPLTLHGLLISLSFWGTAVRAFLFSFLALAVFLVALTEATNQAGVDAEVMTLIYVLGSFLLLDFGYVLVSRAYPLRRLIDIPSIFVADIMVALLYIVPKVVVESGVGAKTHPLIYVFFIPLVVLGLRILLGMLFTPVKR